MMHNHHKINTPSETSEKVALWTTVLLALAMVAGYAIKQSVKIYRRVKSKQKLKDPTSKRQNKRQKKAKSPIIVPEIPEVKENSDTDESVGVVPAPTTPEVKKDGEVKKDTEIEKDTEVEKDGEVEKDDEVEKDKQIVNAVRIKKNEEKTKAIQHLLEEKKIAKQKKAEPLPIQDTKPAPSVSFKTTSNNTQQTNPSRKQSLKRASSCPDTRRSSFFTNSKDNQTKAADNSNIGIKKKSRITEAKDKIKMHGKYLLSFKYQTNKDTVLSPTDEFIKSYAFLFHFHGYNLSHLVLRPTNSNLPNSNLGLIINLRTLAVHTADKILIGPEVILDTQKVMKEYLTQEIANAVQQYNGKTWIKNDPALKELEKLSGKSVNGVTFQSTTTLPLYQVFAAFDTNNNLSAYLDDSLFTAWTKDKMIPFMNFLYRKVTHQYDLCLMSQLPPPDQEHKTTSIITPDGLFQLNGHHEYERIVNSNQLTQIDFGPCLHGYKLCLTPLDQIENPEKNKIYIEIKENTLIYTVMGPVDNLVCNGKISEEELGHPINGTLTLPKLEPLMPKILQITSNRGHTDLMNRVKNLTDPKIYINPELTSDQLNELNSNLTVANGGRTLYEDDQDSTTEISTEEYYSMLKMLLIILGEYCTNDRRYRLRNDPQLRNFMKLCRMLRDELAHNIFEAEDKKISQCIALGKILNNTIDNQATKEILLTLSNVEEYFSHDEGMETEEERGNEENLEEEYPAITNNLTNVSSPSTSTTNSSEIVSTLSLFSSNANTAIQEHRESRFNPHVNNFIPTSLPHK